MSRLAAFLGTPTPTLGIEISATHVSMVRMAPEGSPAAVTGVAVERLRAGAVVPALNAANIVDRAAVSGAIRAALQQLGGRGRRAVLVVPDTIAKVSLLRFDKVPPRAADLAALVSWQVRKSAPFPIDTAQMSYVAGAEVALEGNMNHAGMIPVVADAVADNADGSAESSWMPQIAQAPPRKKTFLTSPPPPSAYVKSATSGLKEPISVRPASEPMILTRLPSTRNGAS